MDIHGADDARLIDQWHGQQRLETRLLCLGQELEPGIMGGVGYTEVYPLERALRDTRLSLIWTGTSQIMNMMIQHEYYDEILNQPYDRRLMEKDAMSPDDSERCFNDEDMWKVHDNEPS